MSRDSVSPRILTVPSGAPFLDLLAGALLSGGLFPGGSPPEGPFGLADALVLLPTRRACRAFVDALAARAGDRPLLLPKVRALGDVDVADLMLDADEENGEFDIAAAADLADVPPAIGETERRLLLTRLVEAWGAAAADALPLAAGEAPLVPGSPAMAAELAAELARLMDTIDTEGIDFSALAGIVPDEFARFWQIALDFLNIIGTQWPALLTERGLMNPAARRSALIVREAGRLARNPPAGPVVAAGSTGSIPATAALLKTIAGLPKGAVILPGLDLDADERDWREVLAAPSHPQHGMARLLAGMGVERAAVGVLDGAKANRAGGARSALAAVALRPAETTDRWHGEAGPLARLAAEAGEKLTYVAARTIEEEALAIALILRHVAEGGETTAALVTPERRLARRVQAELARWDIAIDDSAGTPLAATPPGAFAQLAAGLMADGLEPVPLLALLKHPLARLGMEAAAVRRAARALEIAVLRGPRPEPGIAGLRHALAAARRRVIDGTERDAARNRLDDAEWRLAGALVERLGDIFARAHEDDGPAGATALFRRHRNLCVALAAGRTGEAEPLFADRAGAALRRLFDELVAADTGEWNVAAGDYPALFGTLLAGRPVRPARPGHPRLHILGLLEARLLRFDLVVLGGLNEGTWPAETRTDPWLSRPMRASLGLPPPERRIGLAAHDFAQGFAASEVVLTRAERIGGDPGVASRWLLRLDAVLRPAGGLDALRAKGERWLALARRLDGDGDWRPHRAPEPRPPLALRPRRLSVTEIETWNRDPYAIYARHILGLRPLDALDQPLDAAARGTLIHAALHRLFAGGGAEGSAEEILARLLAIGDELFAGLADAPEVTTFWRRRFARAAQWFADLHAGTRAAIARSVTELRGEIEIAAPGGPFVLTARADRIDVMRDGHLAILDYKTGQPPTAAQVASGLAPQLPLEGAIARAGGFATAGLAPAPLARLAYLHLAGGMPAGDVREIATEPADELAATALRRLTAKIAAFDDERTPYLPRPHVAFAARFGDYDHLARVKEWSRHGAGDDE